MTSEEVLGLLPEVFQRAAVEGSPLAALIEAMQALQAPTEAALASLPLTLNPHTAPERFVPFLARWVDLGWLLRAGVDGRNGLPELVPGLSMVRLRLLIANAARLSQGRGTHRGLLDFLRLAVGLEGFEVRDQAQMPGESATPFHLVILAPDSARPLEGLIHTIMSNEKPAYATYELQFLAGTGQEKEA